MKIFSQGHLTFHHILFTFRKRIFHTSKMTFPVFKFHKNLHPFFVLIPLFFIVCADFILIFCLRVCPNIRIRLLILIFYHLFCIIAHLYSA